MGEGGGSVDPFAYLRLPRAIECGTGVTSFRANRKQAQLGSRGYRKTDHRMQASLGGYTRPSVGEKGRGIIMCSE